METKALSKNLYDEIKRALKAASYDDGHGYDIVDLYDALNAVADILGVPVEN